MRRLVEHCVQRFRFTAAAFGFCVAASSLVWFSASIPLAAQSKKSKAPQEYVFLLPEGFKGWVCVDFNISGAAPLPREGTAAVIRPRPGEVLATSDSRIQSVFYGEAWIETNGQRRPLPKGVTLEPGVSRIGPNEPTQRDCAFVGTEDEREMAGDTAPGFEKRFQEQQHIPPEERDALEALYKSSEGDHWTHRMRWLGPEGTECTWHGVTCAPTYKANDDSTHVIGIDLFQNNLSGSFPEALAHLTHLERLDLSENNLSGPIPEALGGLTQLNSISIHGNNFSGQLPDPLIKKWLTGLLEIIAEPSAFTDVSEVDYESAGTSLLCSRDRIVLRSDGTAKLFAKKCRNKTPQDRATYCEVKEGRIFGQTFGALATLLDKNRFYSLRKEYSRSITDTYIDSLRVTRAGKTHEVVEIAGGSPYELWIIEGFVTGLEADVEWGKTMSTPTCPAWEKGSIP